MAGTLMKLQPDVYMSSDVRPYRPTSIQTGGTSPIVNASTDGMKVAEKGVAWYDKLAKVPGKVSDFGDELNDRFISWGRDLEKASGGSYGNGSGESSARDSLKRTKIGSIGKKTAQWISDNLVIAGGVAVVLVFLVVRGFK